MSFLDTVETRSGMPRETLSPGSYGSGKDAGLKIVNYNEKGSKLDKSGAMRHSFLVSATRPSREANAIYQAALAEVAKSKNGAVAPEPPDYAGTAFFTITLHELWLNMEATSLAFTEASRNKEGVVQADHVAKAIADGDVTEESIAKARAHFLQVATEKCVAANTPADKLEEAVQVQYAKELTQISIKVGQFVTLQDWKGIPRNLQFDPTQLVGTEFSGKVEK